MALVSVFEMLGSLYYDFLCSIVLRDAYPRIRRHNESHFKIQTIPLTFVKEPGLLLYSIALGRLFYHYFCMSSFLI